MLFIVRHLVNISSKFFIIALLIGFLLSITDVYAATEKEKPRQEVNYEEIISLLQKGIKLLKYEIQRDEAIASSKMLIPALRQLRQTFTNDIKPKQRLINDLQSLVPSELSGEIGSLKSTLEQEKTIIQNIQISKRVRRVTRNTIRGLIPIKKQALTSFETALSGYQ